MDKLRGVVLIVVGSASLAAAILSQQWGAAGLGTFALLGGAFILGSEFSIARAKKLGDAGTAWSRQDTVIVAGGVVLTLGAVVAAAAEAIG